MGRKMQKKATQIDYMEVAPGTPDICKGRSLEFYCDDCRYFFLCFHDVLEKLGLVDDDILKALRELKRSL